MLEVSHMYMTSIVLNDHNIRRAALLGYIFVRHLLSSKCAKTNIRFAQQVPVPWKRTEHNGDQKLKTSK